METCLKNDDGGKVCRTGSLSEPYATQQVYGHPPKFALQESTICYTNTGSAGRTKEASLAINNVFKRRGVESTEQKKSCLLLATTHCAYKH